MLNYEYLPFGQYGKVWIKAKEYLKTNIAKSITTGDDFGNNPLHINHLVCIIMYCDYSELSRDFTVSFRKSHPFQVLSQIKRHNSMYYHWSKILKQLISQYGQCYDTKFVTGSNGLLDRLTGPFFCGMSAVLSIPEFAMFIHSPLSTSIHLEVAMRFSGDRGMILEMDNSRGDCIFLRGMDVSWISRYREEEERFDYLTMCCVWFDI